MIPKTAPMTPVTLGAARLRIEGLIGVARHGAPLSLASDPDFRARIEACAAFLTRLLAEGVEVYGVNTGYGDSCTVSIPPDLVAELPVHLSRYHGCGLGRILDEVETRAVLVARLTSVAQGHSAVRWELLEAIAVLLNKNILPF